MCRRNFIPRRPKPHQNLTGLPSHNPKPTPAWLSGAMWQSRAITKKTYYLGTFFFANLRRTGAFFVTSSFLILQGKKNVQFFSREQKYLISTTPSSQGPASALCLLATTIYHTRHCHSHLTNSANRTQGDTNLYIYIYTVAATLQRSRRTILEGLCSIFCDAELNVHECALGRIASACWLRRELQLDGQWEWCCGTCNANLCSDWPDNRGVDRGTIADARDLCRTTYVDALEFAQSIWDGFFEIEANSGR